MERRSEPTDVSPPMTAVAAGDHAAFVAVYRAHVEQVLSYATARCRDAHEVAELSAAVFVAVWENASTYDPTRGSVAAWINGIAARRLADLRRTDARRRRLSQRLSAEALLHDEDVEWIGARIDAERLSPAAMSAIGELSDEQREAFERVAVAGESSDEVGADLGITPTAVRMRVMRARQTLRRAVDG